MPYTFEDWKNDLDDKHEEQLENDREEAAEMEAYFREKDPFFYSIGEADDDDWFELDQADLDAAFEYDLWLSGAE